MVDHPVGDACPPTPPPDPEYVAECRARLSDALTYGGNFWAGLTWDPMFPNILRTVLAADSRRFDPETVNFKLTLAEPAPSDASQDTGPITPADLRHGASVLAERGYMIAAARLRDFADKVEQGEVVIRPKPIPSSE